MHNHTAAVHRVGFYCNNVAMYILKKKGIRLCVPEGVFDLNDNTPQRILEYLYRRGFKGHVEKVDKKKGQVEQGG